ncbi:PAQR family membrane homeostasis protein TrhA [Aeromicrobium wangtongii]|uniref:Hemolysin III family protein n=1 Tax=Aeromicrobium wangtongii TaxID=2969247 RepID=A0ABY5MBU8_9ACTN|nr:hemolysin III family protein [Aeromicrobium wangtongii]MCD9200011.1 hemolysin III family protein [Aeromicrobium wangtongii]UUP13271.1 hemolysin III family protein [Aeromicrobium wangtongii]
MSNQRSGPGSTYAYAGGAPGRRAASPQQIAADAIAGAGRAAGAVHDHTSDAIADIKPRLRGWLHAATAPLAFVSLLVVLVMAEGFAARLGVAVFMVSSLLLFTTSAIYHTGTWSAQRTKLLKRIDHANIFVLIAGSSTPFAILLLSAEHARVLMAVMWGGAAIGVAVKVLWIDAPRWMGVTLYLALGWAPVPFSADFIGGGHHTALLLLAAGGILYSLGALVYGAKRPNPSPAFFGFHEVFHALTIAAFAAHCVGVSLLVTGRG